MKATEQIASSLRAVFYGKNWTWATFKDHLADVTWQQATTKVYDFNTIAVLVFHSYYYVREVSHFLRGNPLTSKDSDSFEHPPIASQADWELFLETVWADVETFAQQIEQLPDSILADIFAEEKYGTYHRNLHGIIEHAHYHLGQIVLIKKILKQAA